MRKLTVALLFVIAILLAGRFWQELNSIANAGGDDPISTLLNGDVNGDQILDMSDAVYLLIHLFNGGPEPIACADSDEIWDEVRAIEGEVNGLAGPLASIAESLAYESCKNRHDRFVDHGNSTVTDRLTNLMWAENGSDSLNWENANTGAAESSHAGHTDWRLPTAMELLSIRREAGPKHAYDWGGVVNYPAHAVAFSESTTMMYPAFPWNDRGELWSSLSIGGSAFIVNFSSTFRASTNSPPQDRMTGKGARNYSLMVRDITPEE